MKNLIIESLDEHAQSGGGRHSVRPMSLELAIKMKEAPSLERDEFENALCQLGHAATPFTAPPNGLSPYQVTLLVGMAFELELTAFGDVVAANLLLLKQPSGPDTVSAQEIKKFCTKFLRGIHYENASFWVDTLQSEHSDLSQKSIAAEVLCNSHSDLVSSQFNRLFSDENPQRGGLAWNIYSKVNAKSCFVKHLVDRDVTEDVGLFLDSIDVADPSGTARSEFEKWIGMQKDENVFILFSDLDYRRMIESG